MRTPPLRFRIHLLQSGGGTASNVRLAGRFRTHLLQSGGDAASNVRLAGCFQAHLLHVGGGAASNVLNGNKPKPVRGMTRLSEVVSYAQHARN